MPYPSWCACCAIPLPEARLHCIHAMRQMCRSPLNALHLLLTLWDDTYGCHQMLRKCATHNMNDSCAGVRKKRKKKQFPLLRELAKSSRIVYILLTEWAKTDFGRFPLFARQLPTACFSPCLFTFPVVKSLWKYCWWDWVDSWCPYLKQQKLPLLPSWNLGDVLQVGLFMGTWRTLQYAFFRGIHQSFSPMGLFHWDCSAVPTPFYTHEGTGCPYWTGQTVFHKICELMLNDSSR